MSSVVGIHVDAQTAEVVSSRWQIGGAEEFAEFAAGLSERVYPVEIWSMPATDWCF